MEAVEWARAHGASGDVEVVSEQSWARVTRIGDVWLKECRPVQAFEVPLTAAHAARWPDRLPTVLAAEGSRLLLADVGTPIAAVGDVADAWDAVLPSYAELQRGETAHAGEHLAHGVRTSTPATAASPCSTGAARASRTRLRRC